MVGTDRIVPDGCLMSVCFVLDGCVRSTMDIPEESTGREEGATQAHLQLKPGTGECVPIKPSSHLHSRGVQAEYTYSLHRPEKRTWARRELISAGGRFTYALPTYTLLRTACASRWRENAERSTTLCKRAQRHYRART